MANQYSPKHNHGRKGKESGAYKSWVHMRERCNNKTCKEYKRYGARGISICKEWGDFKKFFADMGDRPEGTSIDRIDNSLGYFPENCRWATPLQQSNNSSWNKIVEFKCKRKTVADWSRETGVNQKTIHIRMKRGWPLEMVFCNQNFSGSHKFRNAARSGEKS